MFLQCIMSEFSPPPPAGHSPPTLPYVGKVVVGSRLAPRIFSGSPTKISKFHLGQNVFLEFCQFNTPFTPTKYVKLNKVKQDENQERKIGRMNFTYGSTKL